MANEKSLEAVGTILTIGAASFCLKSLGSIGYDGGDPIDNTCLSNINYVTKQPQALIEVKDFAFTSDYHPEDQLATYGEINKNQVITISFATGTITFYGYLKGYEPKEAGKGEAWQATGTIVVTNLDGAIETGPVWA